MSPFLSLNRSYIHFTQFSYIKKLYDLHSKRYETVTHRIFETSSFDNKTACKVHHAREMRIKTNEKCVVKTISSHHFMLANNFKMSVHYDCVGIACMCSVYYDRIAVVLAIN